VDVTGVQIAGVLDDLYTYEGALGVTWNRTIPTLRVWAPTAQNVKLRLFDGPTGGQPRIVEMRRDGGTWSAVGDASWKSKYYQYEVQVYAPSTQKIETNVVTDPYSLDLALNSTRSRIVDLNDAAFKPQGWDTLKKPDLRSVNDLSLYELHVRDFSVNDTSVPAARRGTYLAFTERASKGMLHLRGLAMAGMKAVHLLPTFDIATINEDKKAWKPTPDLSKLPANSDQQQAAVNATRDQDGFNWGYDPYHYNVPEGSYAVNPDARINEYRAMVAAINGAGLRVVQDVVYNHTNASGQAERSVLDRVVPGYYHRLNLNGVVENSTCCANTATEHRMMQKLMVDSVVFWAKTYKIDGFRFDLMGHHMRDDMLKVRAALDALTPQKDGVDGKKIYVYGEGWNFGEVENNKRGVNATQINMYGTGIGTFNDRIRDAIRGGNPFGGLQDQGFATGLVGLPNGQAQNTDRARLLKLTDQIKVGLTGNLRDYRLVDATGKTVTGAQVDYNGAPAGYAASPRESINYASAHDNQTLWDGVLLKAPRAATTAQRVRMQNLAHSLVALGQGVPFFHAGDELLRSKSFDTDSYNSGDWFNAISWDGADNGFGRGLPIAEKNEANWPLYRGLLGDDKLRVTAADRPACGRASARNAARPLLQHAVPHGDGSAGPAGPDLPQRGRQPDAGPHRDEAQRADRSGQPVP
jgi:pullulanase